MKIEGEMIPITINSNIYELDLDEYFLHLRNLNDYIEYGCPILDELGETEPLGFYQKLKLKPKYEEIVVKCWDEHEFFKK